MHFEVRLIIVIYKILLLVLLLTVSDSMQHMMDLARVCLKTHGLWTFSSWMLGFVAGS